MADLYVCPRCGGIEDRCRPPCPGRCKVRGCESSEMKLGALMCRTHARAAWVRVCEIVAAVVIAATTKDYALAYAFYVAEGGGYGPRWVTAETIRAALLGYASVEAMREAERKP